MGKRKVKDALLNGEKIYYRGHARATYMSSGENVESALTKASNDAGQAVTEATIAKNAVATLEGLADATTAMETLAAQVVQIEENKQDVSKIKEELSELGTELDVELKNIKDKTVEDKSEEFVFSDSNGNVIAKIGKEGFDAQNIRDLKNELNNIDKESIKCLKDNILFSEEDTSFCDRFGNVAFCIKKDGTILCKGNTSKWGGKRMLAIGDSITVSNQWQTYVGDELGLSVRTHAKGGIGIIQMVDGDDSGDAPEGYDPDNFGVSTLYALNVEDVKDVDLIVVMGCYNARSLAQTAMGEVTDMYPTNNTFCGQMNYLVDRIYSVLSSANNNRCKLVFVSPHKYGYYPYSVSSAYEDGIFIFEGFKKIADRHSIPLIDLMHNAGINKYNWSVYQKSGTSYNPLYVTSDGSANNGINKPFADVDQLPSSAVNGSLATVGTTSSWDVYIYKDGNWVEASTAQAGHYCWYNDQLHLNDEGQHLIAEYISLCINNLK